MTLAMCFSSLFFVADSAFVSSSANLWHKAFHMPQPVGLTTTFACPALNSRNAFVSPLLARPTRILSRFPASVQASSAIPQEPPKPLDKYKLEAVGTNLPKLDSAKVAFPTLTPERFRHPFDMRATRALQRLFPFDFVIRQGLGAVVEQAMFLDNLSTAVRVGPNQLPKIYNRSFLCPSGLSLRFPIPTGVLLLVLISRRKSRT